MTAVSVGYWNIEKTGVSSTFEKQAKVNTFLWECCAEQKLDLVFLCEVHSAREESFLQFLTAVYGPAAGGIYDAEVLHDGNSNSYLLLWNSQKISRQQVMYQRDLLYLNRGAFVVRVGEFWLALAHFKSGQTGVTSAQIVSCAGWLQGASQANRWGIIGDLNWDVRSFGDLQGLPVGATPRNYWPDMSHRGGGILDWCMTDVSVNAIFRNLLALFRMPEMFDMNGPDHRPLICTFRW